MLTHFVFNITDIGFSIMNFFYVICYIKV